MAYKIEPTNKLIKFVRGTTEQFENLVKQEDTLYFIYDNNQSNSGRLYLGSKQIGDGSPGNISDLIEGTFSDGDLLIYDAETDEWVAESVDNAIRTMVGATNLVNGQGGLVPTPTTSDTNKFLRGDGTWANFNAVDNVSLSLNGNNEIGLKDFSSAAVGSIPKKTAEGLQWVPMNSVVGGLTYSKVNSLADVVDSSIIYLVPNTNSATNNLYDEYMYIDNQPELIGSIGNIDLTGYTTTTVFNAGVADLQAALNNKVNQSDFISLSNTVNNIDERLTWQEVVEE